MNKAMWSSVQSSNLAWNLYWTTEIKPFSLGTILLFEARVKSPTRWWGTLEKKRNLTTILWCSSRAMQRTLHQFNRVEKKYRERERLSTVVVEPLPLSCPSCVPPCREFPDTWVLQPIVNPSFPSQEMQLFVPGSLYEAAVEGREWTT